MTRLPPRPDLTWKEDGTPVNEQVGDIYYAVEDGLAETRAIFLEACGLPERWAGREAFNVAELGFGTGLNFLALWQLWREARGETGWLHFVSFEGFPLDTEDAEKALSVWPEIKELTDKLIAKWPYRAKGVHRVVWPEERLTLTLHLGLIEEALPRSQFKADAWFLDGFAPAKNGAMWSDTLWPLVAERSEGRAIAATFTVAGAVRRGLAAAGFEVSKRPGHGRKRERLEAVFPATSKAMAEISPKHVHIIGAGIAGACLARALTDRSVRVTVYDTADGPAQGTSGNPMALLMPRLDAGDTPQARFLVEAYNAARVFYTGRSGVEETEVLQRAKDEQEQARFEKVLADPPLGLEDLEAVAGALLHKRALILRPAMLLPALLEGIDVRWGVSGPERLEGGEGVVIYANGWRMERAFPWLRLKGRAGQVNFARVDVDAPTAALASGHYALASGRDRLWGATYRDHDGGEPALLNDDVEANDAALGAVNPYWRQTALSTKVQSRAGVRATTPDRLPVIGAVPDYEYLLQTHASLRTGASAEAEVARLYGQYLAGGFGSRGFTFGPWAAQVLTAQICGDPFPTWRDSLALVDPARQILRDLRRGLI